MSTELTPAWGALVVLEAALLLAGAILCWRLVIAPRTVWSPVLPPWNVRLGEFLGAAFGVVLAGLGAHAMVVQVARWEWSSLPVDSDWWLVAQGAAFQGGMLLAALIAGWCLRERTERPTRGSVWLGGIATFLAALPVVLVASWIWRAVLEAWGVSLQQQALVELFREAESTPHLLAMGFLAVVVAPVTEELVFRAGLFRYLRTRVPRIVALVLPSLIFAALHGTAAAVGPLVVLGIAFSVAYERTGRIAVPMVAHGLFNLHTIVLLLLGVEA